MKFAKDVLQQLNLAVVQLNPKPEKAGKAAKGKK